MVKMYTAGFYEVYIPDNTGPGVPARIRLQSVVDPHRNHIFTSRDCFCHITVKAHITIAVAADPLSVDIYRGILIDALKVQLVFPVQQDFRQIKMLPIPAEAGSCVSAAPAGRRVIIQRIIHGPVMRELNRSHALFNGINLCIVCIDCKALPFIVQDEQPVFIKQCFLPHTLLLSASPSRCRGYCDDK